MMKGQKIRVMWSSHTLTSGMHSCNVFVKNFPNNYDEGKLKETFEAYGAVLSCKVGLLKYYLQLRSFLSSVYYYFSEIN